MTDEIVGLVPLKKSVQHAGKEGEWKTSSRERPERNTKETEGITSSISQANKLFHTSFSPLSPK